MAKITQQPSEVDITGVAGSPFVLTVNITAVDQNDTPISWSAFSAEAVVINGRFGPGPASAIPTITSPGSGQLTISWTAAQTQALVNGGPYTWALQADISSLGPYSLIAGRLRMESASTAGPSTSTTSGGVITGGATVNVSVTLGGSGGGGGGGGAVSSVFTRTGAVTAQSGDYSSFYDAAGAAATAQSTAESYADTNKLAKSANLSDVASTTTARSNLGLGSAATHASTDFDAAGVAATAQSNAESFALPKAGGTMSGAIAMGSNKITGLANGSASSDAAAYGQIASAITYQRLIAQYGEDPANPGYPNKPWIPEATVGPNMWDTSNFDHDVNSLNGAPTGTVINYTTLTPSVTGGASAAGTLTRIPIEGRDLNPPNPQGNWNWRTRIRATVTASGPLTGGSLRLRVGYSTAVGAVYQFGDASGNKYTTSTGYPEWDFSSGGRVANPMILNFEMSGIDELTSNRFLDVYLLAGGGTTGSTLTLTNVSIHQIQMVTPPMRVAWDRATGGASAGGVLYCDCPTGYDGAGNLIRTRFTFAPDDTLPLGFVGTTSQLEAQAWASSGATLAYNSGLAGQYPNFELSVGNSDITMGVIKTDGTSELRGNTHHGETGATGTYTTDCKVYLDYGDGNGFVGPYLAQGPYEWWNNCVRVKIVVNSVLTRSDQGSPFASIAKTYYLYRDGTLRYDRTFTYLQDQIVTKWFWHMASFTPNAGQSTYRGRLGSGLNTLQALDTNAYMAVPTLTGAPSVTASGGSIPVNVDPNTHYSVRVTAMTETGGETTGSIAYSMATPNVSVAGSTITVSWNAVTGASNYGIYFGPRGFERRVATVATGTTTYTILGTEVPGQTLPQTSTAMVNSITGTVSSSLSEWTIYYDPESGLAMSMALDRKATLAMPGVSGYRVDLQRLGGGLLKTYFTLNWPGNDLPQTIPSGTVYSGTVWWFVYTPEDQVNFHRDQAPRASSCALLPSSLYPST